MWNGLKDFHFFIFKNSNYFTSLCWEQHLCNILLHRSKYLNCKSVSDCRLINHNSPLFALHTFLFIFRLRHATCFQSFKFIKMLAARSKLILRTKQTNSNKLKRNMLVVNTYICLSYI